MPRNIFDPNGYAVASQSFTYAGVEYEKGAEFPHKDIGVIEFDLRGLWLADKIDFTPPPVAKVEASSKKARPRAE